MELTVRILSIFFILYLITITISVKIKFKKNIIPYTNGSLKLVAKKDIEIEKPVLTFAIDNNPFSHPHNKEINCST